MASSISTDDLQLLEGMLNKRRWCKDCLRVNIAEPHQIVHRGVNGQFKIAVLQSEVLPKKETALRELVKRIAPEWWGDEETQVLLNKNVTCRKHRDKNNGHSYILWLGDFVGGGLVFEDGTRLEQKHIWHKIDGQIPHWNEPHEGTKYGVVLYRRGVKHTKQQMVMLCRKRKEDAMKKELLE
jgi:hypothetical protein